MEIDPVLSAVARLSLACLFGSAALHKLRDPGAFAATIRDYRIVDDRLATGLAMALIGVETTIAVALVVPVTGPWSGIAAALLLSAYSAAIALNLVRGRRDVDCGCLGPGRRQPLSEWLLVRNGLLFSVGLVVTMPVSDRTLVWADAFSALGGLTAAVLLFAAGTQLIANAPTSQRLRRSS